MGIERRIVFKYIWVLILIIGPFTVLGQSSKVAYDIDMAKEMCDQLPLENVEGVWLYPDDKVTVLILRQEEKVASPEFSTYSISVVETSDARLHPGEVIGSLTATAQDKVFKIELITERKNDLLLKPKSVLATLNNDSDAFIIKRQKAPFKGRLNLNLSRLLPGFWKMVSMGVSQNGNNSSVQLPAGMIKIYPSYDGNGSSRRKIRYL